MTEEITTPTSSGMSAGALLRQTRETQGVELDVLAHALHVSPAKLRALEADRLDELPDAMFARALTLAVCRQLKVDAAPVLALLPGQDVSRLAAKDERGLDFPLERPSFLPQSSFAALIRLFSPMRGAALMILVLALLIALWPETQGWLTSKEASTSDTVVPVDSPAVAAPTAEEPASAGESMSGHMVVTTVHPTAVAAQASQATSATSGVGVPDGK